MNKKDNKNSTVSVIFDMDGTMVDSAQVTIPAFEKVCPLYGYDTPTDEQIMGAIGYASPVFYYKIFPDKDKAELIKLGEKVEQAERELVPDINEGMLFAGIDKLLEDLKRRGCMLYVASTGGVKHVDTCLKACSIYSYFEEIHCDAPDKELMVEGIVKNAPDNTWIMVGDRTKDYKAAKHNGIVSAAAAFGYCNKEDYKQFDYVLNSPQDLLEIIDKKIL